MSNETKVILAKRGTGRREVLAKNIEIEDLWYIAIAIKGGDHEGWGQEERDVVCDKILSVWHTAHDLKRHIVEDE